MRRKVSRVCALLSVGVALLALAAIPFLLERPAPEHPGAAPATNGAVRAGSGMH